MYLIAALAAVATAKVEVAFDIGYYSDDKCKTVAKDDEVEVDCATALECYQIKQDFPDEQFEDFKISSSHSTLA